MPRLAVPVITARSELSPPRYMTCLAHNEKVPRKVPRAFLDNEVGSGGLDSNQRLSGYECDGHRPTSSLQLRLRTDVQKNHLQFDSYGLVQSFLIPVSPLAKVLAKTRHHDRGCEGVRRLACGYPLVVVHGQAGRRLLRRGIGGSAEQWNPGDIQHRPGQSVHRRWFHRPPGAQWGQKQHGRERAVR